MKDNRSLKLEFYLLVVKIILFTLLSSLLVYSVFIIPIYRGKLRPVDYYMNYLNRIEKQIKEHSVDIMKGNLIDLKKYSKEIQGEVVDTEGNHLYGDYIYEKRTDYWSLFNKDFVKEQYVYKYVPIVINGNLKGIYILKAPFSFVNNNINEHPFIAVLYVPAVFSPVLFFILYLFVFTRKLYLDISRNINILLRGTENIMQKNFDFKIEGIKGIEFMKIQDTFNEMIRTISSTLKLVWDLDEERKMMLSSIAHDIRTPITVIKGQMEIMEKVKCEDYKLLENLINIVNNNCNRIVNLVNNLSLLGRIENPDYIIRKEYINLFQLLKQKEKEMKLLADSKKLIVEFDINLSKEFYCLDETLLISVIDNILYNSLRFTSKGQIKLVVYDKEDKIFFKCTDTGKGFNPNDISNLFKAYYKGEDYKGHFGLGLYISKKIVNKFNGEIWAYNNKDGGASVEFFIKEF